MSEAVKKAKDCLRNALALYGPNWAVEYDIIAALIEEAKPDAQIITALKEQIRQLGLHVWDKEKN